MDQSDHGFLCEVQCNEDDVELGHAMALQKMLASEKL